MTERLDALLAAADDEIDAFAVFTAVADDAVLVSPSGERWFREDPRSTSSAAGSYAAEWAMNAFFREPGRALLRGNVDGEPVAFRVESDPARGGCRVENVDPAGLPEPADGLAGGSRWARVLDELAPLGFTPRYAPITLAQLADFCVDSSDTDAVRRTAHIARSRSGFPFHEFEALTAGYTLAAADAADAIRSLRAELETCSLVFAERWGRLVTIDMADETAFVPDPSPTGGMTFSPDAHILGDWLELSVSEVAQGRGNLVVLGKRFAENNELVADADDPSVLHSAHPVRENPWVLWLVDVGAVQRFELRLIPGRSR